MRVRWARIAPIHPSALHSRLDRECAPICGGRRCARPAMLTDIAPISSAGQCRVTWPAIALAGDCTGKARLTQINAILASSSDRDLGFA